MNRPLITLLTIVGLILAFYAFNQYIYNEKQGDPLNTSEPTDRDSTGLDEAMTLVQVIPISHATAILKWDSAIIYTDPTGGAMMFRDQPEADIILVTDIHGDHYSPETLMAVLEVSPDATLIAPQAVIDMMPEELASKAQALANDQSITVLDFDITGIPMYNLPESPDSRHPKGRGNGYLIERGGYRTYIAGDTAGTPEMRALKDIDLALIPMNEPFTMSVEEAADAVRDFKPKQVYPFHYRGQDGFADVDKFKRSVNAGEPDIDVVLLDWYPQEDQ